MKKVYLIVFSLLVLGFYSCQDEKETIVETPQDTITKTSPLATLIKRVAQKETSIDNVIDGTSCFSLKLPIHIEIDGYYLDVENVNDYHEVQEIKNEYSTDDDIVSVSLPFTIIYPDYHQVVVNTQAQFNAIIAQCGNDTGFYEIACIDFNYPFSINVYDTNNQVGSSITIQDNAQLYNFINDLNEGKIVGIVYPLTLTKSGGDTVTVTSNLELEDAIESVINDCNSTILPDFEDVLKSNTWHISNCYYDQDYTSYYTGYNFTFYSNYTSTGIKNTTTVNGSWHIETEGSEKKLKLNFSGNQLQNIQKEWEVTEYSENTINLKYENGGGSDCYYMTFSKN